MAARPQFQLRLRSEEQLSEFKKIAAWLGVSVNEWFLRRIENGEGVSGIEDTGRGGKERAGRKSPRVPKISADDYGAEVSAVGVGDSGTAFSGFASQIDRFVAERKSGHDVNSCRVYGCGMCAALKGK